jgi:hypothetical protein
MRLGFIVSWPWAWHALGGFFQSNGRASHRRDRVFECVSGRSSCGCEIRPGLDLPLVTGRFTAVTGLTGLDRLRYRPVTNR